MNAQMKPQQAGELTKDQLAKIRAALKIALDQVAKDHGLEKLIATTCTYDPSGSFRFKIEGQTAGGLSKEAKRYTEFVRMYGTSEGLPPLGWEFTNPHSNEKLRITGLNQTATKVLVRCDLNSREYWYRIDAMRTIYSRPRAS